MAVILPQKRTTQPQGNIAIDWSNPLTKGLIFCQVGDTAFDVVNNIFSQSGSGIPSKSTGRGGKARAYQSSADFYSGNVRADNATEVGVFAFVDITTLNANAAIFAHTSNLTTQQGFSAFQNSSGISIFDGNDVQHSTNISSAQIVGVGSTTLGATLKLNHLTAYLNGRQTANKVSAVAAPRIGQGLIKVASSRDVVSLTGKYFLALMWDRTPGPEEYAALHANPWQIFKQTSSITYSAPVGSASNVNVNHSIPPFTQTANAAARVATQVAHSIAPFNQTLTAGVRVSATANQAIPAFTQAFTANLNDNRHAVVTHSIPPFTQTANAAARSAAQLAHSIPPFSQSAIAGVRVSAQAAQTIQAFTQTFIASAQSFVSAAVNQSMPAFGQTASAKVATAVVLLHTMPAFTQTFSALNDTPEGRLKQAIKEAYASAPSGVIVIHTLEFRHPAFVNDVGAPSAIRVVQGHRNLEAKLEDDAPQNPGEYVIFIPMAFEFEPPNVENIAIPEIGIAIDNVTREIEDNLRIAAASPYPIEVTYRPYLNTDLTEPQMNPPVTLILTSAEADDYRVTARGSYGNAANVLCPRETYNRSRFPGLQR